MNVNGDLSTEELLRSLLGTASDEILVGMPAIRAALPDNPPDATMYRLIRDHGLPVFRYRRGFASTRMALLKWFRERAAEAGRTA